MKITKILNTDLKAKLKVLEFIDLLSVWEPGGQFRTLVKDELEWIHANNKSLVRSNIVTAHNDAGAFVGYAFYYPATKSVEIYVLPHLRRQGIGSALIEGMREWSGTATLMAYTGFEGSTEFFKANYILNYDDYQNITLKQIMENGGDYVKAYRKILGNAKRKNSLAYGQSIKEGKFI